MSRRILRQKLLVPPAWPDAMRRERLLGALDAARVGGRHVVLLAGSGYGKTTLLADWARDQGAAWLALDADDTDLDAFVAYLIASIEAALPGFATQASALLPHAREREGAQAAVDALIVDLDEQCERPLVVVLDDYHLCVSPSLDALVGRLMRYLPPSVRLAVAARRAPGLDLASLRAKRQLELFDERALAFTPEELASLVPGAAPEELSRLHAETGGWPAAQGLAPELRDAYLEEVALGEQPRETRDLLMRLAMLDAFTLELARALPGVTLDEASADALVGQRLLLGVGPGQFALPRPLGRLLRERFAAVTSRGERQAFHAALAERLWADGQALSALSQWLEAGEGGRAAERLESVAEAWLLQGRLEALANALALLEPADDPRARTMGDDPKVGPKPDERGERPKAERPALHLAEGELFRRWGEFERAERAFERAAALFALDVAGVARCRLRQALVRASRGDTARARELWAEARPAIAPDGPDALDASNLEGGLALFAGDSAGAIACYEDALARSRAHGVRVAEARARHNLGVCYTRLGDYERALASYDAGLALATTDGVPAVWMTPINRALALVYLERPAEAVSAAEDTLALVRRFKLAREEGYALRILGYARLRAEKLEAAEECFASAARLAERTEDRLGLAFTRNFQAEAASLAGDHVGAIARLGEVETLLAGRAELDGLPEFAHTRARVLVAAGRHDDARPVLEALVARARAGGYQRLLEEAQTLQRALKGPATPRPAQLKATGPLPPLAPPALAVRCFAGLHVLRFGAEIADREWQSLRAKLLVAFLLHTPEGATKERLFEALFPNEQPTDAAVNMCLMRARKALEPGLEKGQLSRWILRGGNSYVFNREAELRLDTHDFESALAAARKAPPEEETRLLDAALALYRGEFLPGYEQGWVLALRQRFRQRALEACRRRLELVPDDDHLVATEVVHRALEIDPLSEEFHRELMLRYLEAGEPQRAREHYAVCEARYREALGTTPPEDLAALVARA